MPRKGNQKQKGAHHKARQGNPFQGDQSGDPLAGWGKVNLATPKKPKKAKDVEDNATVYSDGEESRRDDTRRRSPSPSRRRARSSEYERRRGPSLSRSRDQSSEYARRQSPSPSQTRARSSEDERRRSPSLSRSRARSSECTRRRSPSLSRRQAQSSEYTRRQSSSPPRHEDNIKKRKKLTPEEHAACPYGDTRWPPPRTSYPQPLQFLFGNNECIFYHLIHENGAKEAQKWKKHVLQKARKARKEMVADQNPQVKVLQAVMGVPKKMKLISEGKRGRIYHIEETDEVIVGCILELQDKAGSVKLAQGRERFGIFGLGLKRIKGDVLLISEVVGS